MILVLVSMLFLYNNEEFINTAQDQMAEGYSWKATGCQTPEGTVPALPTENQSGNEIVCFKLEK